MNFICTFFKLIWQLINFIRKFINSFICLVFIFIAISTYFSYKKDNIYNNQYNGALLINLKGIIVDQISIPNPIDRITQKLLRKSNHKIYENSLFNIVNIIRHAIYDNKITGIVLQLDNLINADQPALQYIGKALTEFKASGKPIYAIGNTYNQLQYYLASFANNIYMSQQGNVEIFGYSTNKLYYKSLLDKLKINTHIFRVGNYKSAVEPFLRNNMSPETREADTVWINAIWQNYLSTIAQNRKTNPKNIFSDTQNFIKEIKSVNGNVAQHAIKKNLIDHIFTDAVIEQELIKIFGWNNKQQHYNYISIYDYAHITPQIKAKNNLNKSDKTISNIAVIIANGTIINGKEEPGIIGSESIVEKIRKARLNTNIKAIILRINSPGGSVTAAETIRNELLAAHDINNKVIIVSMGGMAASGGYWISTPANYIIASPTTLTGSIGIFGLIHTFEKTLNTIGIYTDGISNTSLADISITKGINQDFFDMMQLTIENSYRTFIQYVANARNKKLEEIEKIAQGRIWIGSDAFKKGLIDKLGDFDDAIEKAVELGAIKVPVLDWMQPEYSFIDELLLDFTLSAQIITKKILQSFISNKTANNLNQQIQMYKNMNDPKNHYAFCVNCPIYIK
ncbi:signal peptide peptidase SppA [Arsenophonus symbiont of Ornithomya chloropus]|uniref:signal peptide peptidase SppA n=1 Tax=Arsenophonus symbiont of Ornithomya chloropus TaxID=634121 RepID=UPI0032B1F755